MSCDVPAFLMFPGWFLLSRYGPGVRLAVLENDGVDGAALTSWRWKRGHEVDRSGTEPAQGSDGEYWGQIISGKPFNRNCLKINGSNETQ